MNDTDDMMGEENGTTHKLCRMLLITLPIVVVFAVFFIIDFCLFHRKKERSRKYRHLLEDGPRNRVGHSAFPGEVSSISGKISIVRSTTVHDTIDVNGADCRKNKSRDTKVIKNDSGSVECTLASQSRMAFHSDPDITDTSHQSVARMPSKQPANQPKQQRRQLPFMLGLFARNLDEVT